MTHPSSKTSRRKQLSSTTRTLWDRLTDESTDEGKYFMPHYTELNDKLGNALGRLEEQPQDIQGRDHEIRLLHAILERPKTPIALLLGQAGVGKTALAEEFAKQLNQGKLDKARDRIDDQPHAIQGRDHELRLLHASWERPKTPIALLLGQAGVGKTALAEQFAKQLNQGKLDTHTNYQYLLVAQSGLTN